MHYYGAFEGNFGKKRKIKARLGQTFQIIKKIRTLRLFFGKKYEHKKSS